MLFSFSHVDVVRGFYSEWLSSREARDDMRDVVSVLKERNQLRACCPPTKRPTSRLINASFRATNRCLDQSKGSAQGFLEYSTMSNRTPTLCQCNETRLKRSLPKEKENAGQAS